ncbi:MAG: hypothetical protein M9938_08550 [Solirubrobacterales bacterium]|nr:hypothetical protein [Solirubrobacterales bacterium]
MNAPDSSVLIAGFVPSHRYHPEAISALAEVKKDGNLIAHTIAESYSVLSSPGGSYRAEPGAVVMYLEQFIGDQPVGMPPSTYPEAVRLLTETNRAGGMVYDALIGLAARDAGLALLSLDARARPIYELCGAEFRILADLGT